MRKRPCKRTKTKNLRNRLRFFLALSNPYPQKISHWPSTFFGYPQPLGVCAIFPGDCDLSDGTAEPARWRHKPLHCQRRRFRFDAIPAHCTICWHIEHAQFRNFEMKKWIIFCFFSVLRLWRHKKSLQTIAIAIAWCTQGGRSGSHMLTHTPGWVNARKGAFRRPLTRNAFWPFKRGTEPGHPAERSANGLKILQL